MIYPLNAFNNSLREITYNWACDLSPSEQSSSLWGHIHLHSVTVTLITNWFKTLTDFRVLILTFFQCSTLNTWIISTNDECDYSEQMQLDDQTGWLTSEGRTEHQCHRCPLTSLFPITDCLWRLSLHWLQWCGVICLTGWK